MLSEDAVVVVACCLPTQTCSSLLCAEHAFCDNVLHADQDAVACCMLSNNAVPVQHVAY